MFEDHSKLSVAPLVIVATLNKQSKVELQLEIAEPVVHLHHCDINCLQTMLLIMAASRGKRDLNSESETESRVELTGINNESFLAWGNT